MRKTNLPKDFAEYHKARNHYCAKLRDAKKTYYTNLIQESSGDSKKLFQVANSLCKERNNNMLPPHSDSLQLANDFGDYFYRKITLIQEEIQRCNIPPPSFTVPCPSSSLKRFRTITQDVSKLIMSSSNATCRLDLAPTWLVKDCVNELSPIFMRMINFSLTSGCVPSIWISALVVPLLKKTGLELTLNNFRPVSILSLISKVAEKVVIPQILDHCREHAPLSSYQSAYHQHHSTETALLKVHNDILLNMDKQKVTLLVLLDLSAAFGTINHVNMKNILENDFGFRDTALQWIISFLTDRKQHVVIDKSTSKPFDLSSGVPQGSCLEPILFIMYVSRLFNVINKHLPDAQGYADDTQLYLSFWPDSTSSQEEALRALEDCIPDIRAWMVNHEMYVKSP